MNTTRTSMKGSGGLYIIFIVLLIGVVSYFLGGGYVPDSITQSPTPTPDVTSAVDPSYSTAYTGVNLIAATNTNATPLPGAGTTLPSGAQNLLPRPYSVTGSSDHFSLTNSTGIYVNPAGEVQEIGQYLADKLNASTKLSLKTTSTTTSPGSGNIYLTTTNADPTLGEEGYELKVTASGVTITAPKPAGLFRGVQTLRQLVPISSTSLPGVTIKDFPRYSWRGNMLDIARHFYTAAQIKAYIEELSYFKINVLHLHLSDDSGWRLQLSGWPNLTIVGSRTNYTGGTGGYLTTADYASIILYAQKHYMTIVPEVDIPSHITAALNSYPQLGCNGSLCTTSAETDRFLNDLFHQLATMTPGSYIHIGADESSVGLGAYNAFIKHAQDLIKNVGKQTIGWEETHTADFLPTTVVQFWTGIGRAQDAAQKGQKIIMSPRPHAYLSDGISVQGAYSWDPSSVGIPADKVLGVEGCIWTESTPDWTQLQATAFPGMIGLAEVGWSPGSTNNFSDFSTRMAAIGSRYVSQ